MPGTMARTQRRWIDPRRLLRVTTRRHLEADAGLVALFEHLDRHGPAGAPGERRAAEIARCSRATLKRRFPCLEAGTFARFVKRWRLRCARRDLRNRLLSVKEVARRCGLPNQSAFSRDFHAEFGVTPRDYRRRWLEKRRG